MNELVVEQATELQLKLQDKDKQLQLKDKQLNTEKRILLEETILSHFQLNEQCIYYGTVDNLSTKNEKLIKIGYSNDLSRRVKEHKQTYDNFTLIKAFKVLNPINIENCIKQHKILSKKRRSIEIENKKYIELFAYEELTLDKINEYILKIIEENEYNIENYNKLLQTNKELIYDNNNLKEENDKLKEENDKYKNKVSRTLTSRGYVDECTNGYYIYIFKISDIRYISNICRVDEIDKRTNELQTTYNNGEIVYKIEIKYPIFEKITHLIFKKIFTPFGNSIYEGSIDDIKNYLDFIKKFENILIVGLKNINEIHDLLDAKPNIIENVLEDNPEIPIIRKSKRPIDKIDPITKEVLATCASIEEAGRQIGCTGSAVGIALRNKKLCKGFLFVYSGLTVDEQFLDQPVIKINCNTGERTEFKNIASAARNANISAPGLRNRINTDVHVNNYHWIWSPNSKHYESIST